MTETAPAEVSTWGMNNVNASVGFITGNARQYEVMLWARNLTDHRAIVGAFPTVAQPGSFSGFPNQPRTFGVTLRVTF